MHIAGFRRLTFITNRIGHLAAEPDCFLKARALGELPHRHWLFLAPQKEIANEHLLSYWSPRIRAVRNPIACSGLAAMSSLGLMRYDTGRYVLWLDRTQDIYRLNARWSGRPPVLSLTQEDERWGGDMLAALGVPSDGWFACVHVRESGFSTADDATHAHRNGSAEAVISAMEEIVRRGGRCIRMGDPTSQRLPSLPGVVDYAHHSLRSARLDVVLCAKAKFFLGNSSGLALVSSVFGRPSLLANMVPLSAMGVLPEDLSIPKLYWSPREKRPLRFSEIFGTPAANYRYAEQYKHAGIAPQENTAEEIRDGVIELLDRLDGRGGLSEEDRALQRRFLAMLRPGDYAYGAASSIAASFLRRHRELLA
jgi:putative glycosyltransferase (TIGR04372 family)